MNKKYKCPYCGKKRKVLSESRVCNECRSTIAAKKRVQNVPLYNLWHSLITRCYKETSSLYKSYGAKGVTVCQEWRENKDSFIVWAKRQGYQKGQKLLREGTEYSPDACRFETKKIIAKIREPNAF